MSQFNPSKLSVTLIPPTTTYKPLDRRRYTLTHSDSTGDLFLSIGTYYDINSVNQKLRDEVIAEWIPQLGQYVLSGKVYVSSGEFDEHYAQVRYLIFQKELDTAISAMIYGDRSLFLHYPWLLDSPIYIYFESNFQSFNKMIYFGTPRQYLKKIAEQPVT